MKKLRNRTKKLALHAFGLRPVAGAVACAVIAVGCASDPEESESATPKKSLPTMRMEDTELSLRPIGNDQYVDAQNRTWSRSEVTNTNPFTGDLKFGGESPGVPDDDLSDEQLALNRRMVRVEYPATGTPIEYRQLTITDQDVADIHAARAKTKAHINMRFVNGVAQEFPAKPGIGAPLSPSLAQEFSAKPGTGPLLSQNLAQEFHQGPGLLSQNYESPVLNAGRTSWFANAAKDVDQRRPDWRELLISSPALNPANLQTPDYVIGSPDERVFLDHSYSSSGADPSFRAAVALTNETCSATMIQTHTAMSAAHCFFQNGVPAPTVSWATAFVNTRNPTTGVITTTSAYPSTGPQSGCLSVYYPTSWTTGCGSVNPMCRSSDDYAIMRFDCGLSPGATGGVMYPAYSNTPSDYSSNYGAFDAYDSIAPLPPNQNSSPTLQYIPGSLIYRNVPASDAVADADGWTLHEWFDTTGGSSGGGVLLRLFEYNYGDPTTYWIGDNTWQFASPYGNAGVKLNATEWATIVSVVNNTGGVW